MPVRSVNMPLDVATLRMLFPALERKVGGRPAVYLDGPAGTQVPRTVIDAVSSAMVTSVSNVGGGFAASDDSVATVAASRAAAADLLGGSPNEIVFGPNMTTLTFAFTRALARDWGPGDRVVVTRLDHDANVTPWVMAAEDRGAEVSFVDIRPDDVTLDMEDLVRVLDPSVRWVAVTGCSNAFGSEVDLRSVADAAHSVGARCFVDAVHLAPHRRIDVEALGCDALVCSAYKFFGPHVGILWGSSGVLEETRPYKVRPAPAGVPGKFETGTPSFPLLAGVTAAVDYLAAMTGAEGSRPDRLDDAFTAVRAHEIELGNRFLGSLPTGVRVWGRPTMEGRVATFAVSVDGRTPRDAAADLAARGIFVWHGHYYAVEPMRALGLLDGGGLVRIGFLHHTTAEEVDRLLEALEDMAGR